MTLPMPGPGRVHHSGQFRHLPSDKEIERLVRAERAHQEHVRKFIERYFSGRSK